MQMKKTLRNIFFITALSPLLVQCASQDEVQRLQYQLHVVNKRLVEMQNSTVGDIQKRQAASSNQIDQLENEILTLKSQLEETNHLNRSLKEQNKELQNNIGEVAKEEALQREEALRKIEEEQQAKEARISELTEKLKTQQEGLQAIQDARVREAERRAQEARAKADSARAKALVAGSSASSSGTVVRLTPEQGKRVVTSSSQPPAPASPAPSQAQAAPVVTAPRPAASRPAVTEQQEVAVPAEPAQPVIAETATPAVSPLAGAEQLFQQKQYGKAYEEFERIASADPASDEGVTSGYMMGECLFAQKEYDKAILQYQKIISQSGNHPKAASATLKQAMAFEQLADNETARMIYKKIVNHYSSSPEAKVAKEKLGKL